MTIPSLRPEPKRDRFGRYVLPKVDGSGTAAYTRATTMSGTLKDLYPLMAWKQRMTAVGVVRSDGTHSHIQRLAMDIEDAIDWREAKDAKAEFDELIEKTLMPAAGATRGADQGTEAHSLSEWADAGRLDEVRQYATESQLRDLMAYLERMALAGIERPVEYIERIVINTRVETAGTFDRLVRLVDGRLVVADLKSQQTVDFGFLEICAQLAQYAQADWMVDGDRLVPMPSDLDRTIGIVMHAPVGSGTCDLYQVDLTTGWEAACLAYQLRELRKMSKKYGWPYTAPRQVTGHDQLLYLIDHAQTRESLEGLWRNHTSEWQDVHTSAARRRATALAG